MKEHDYEINPESSQYEYNETDSEKETKLKALLQKLEINAEDLSPILKQRLYSLLDAEHIFSSLERGLDITQQLFEKLCEKELSHLNEEEKKQWLRAFKQGEFFSDIGKTGPIVENVELQSKVEKYITLIYETKGKINPYVTSLQKFIKENVFSEHSPNVSVEEILSTLEQANIGVSREMTMRGFFNLHANWSYRLLQTTNIPEESQRTAAMHHALENVNGIDGSPINPDELEKVTPENIIRLAVIILDKYEALRTRSELTPEESLALLSGTIEILYGNLRKEDEVTFQRNKNNLLVFSLIETLTPKLREL